MPTSVKRKNENIIDFDERRRYKSLEEQSDSNTERWYLVEIYNKLQEIANSNYKVLSKKLSEEHIIELEKENEMLKKKIKKSFPVHIMFYSIISSIFMTMNATLLVLRFALGVYIIDPYYLICGLLISLTLFCNSLYSGLLFFSSTLAASINSLNSIEFISYNLISSITFTSFPIHILIL